MRSDSDWPGEFIEAAAYASLYAAAPSPIEGDESMVVRRFEHVVARVCEPLPGAPVLNSVLCAGAGGLALSDELKLVDDALEWMREHRAGGYLSVAPGTSTERALIEERGFARGYAWMKFSCDLNEEPANSAQPTDLQIEEVGGSRARDFGVAFAEGFDMPAFGGTLGAAAVGSPGWHCFCAFDGDRVAASGALYVSEDVAWLGMGATRSSYRRRGAQSALLAARLRLARELGCTVAFTETGERVPDRPSNSYRNILRAGFEEAYLRPNLVISS